MRKPGRKRSASKLVEKNISRLLGQAFDALNKALQESGAHLQRDTKARIRGLRKTLAPVVRGTGKAGTRLTREAEKQLEAISMEARKALRQAINAAADSMERAAKKL